MTHRRPDDTDDEWRRRRSLEPLRAEVRRAQSQHRLALDELRVYAWRARYVTAALVTGVLSLLGIVAVITLERWYDGFSAYLGLFIPLTLVGLIGGMMFTDEYEQRTKRRNTVVRTAHEYREVYTTYVDAGGGLEPTDALLVLPDVRRR